MNTATIPATMSTLKGRIAWICQARGISYRELARRSGIAETSISTSIRRAGDGDMNATKSTLEAIARGGNVSAEWLITGNGSPEGELSPVLYDAQLTAVPLEYVLASSPLRWSSAAIAAAREVSNAYPQLPERTWLAVLDGVDAAIRDVASKHAR